MAKVTRVVVDARITGSAEFKSTKSMVSSSNRNGAPVLFAYDEVPKEGRKVFIQDVPTFVDFFAVPAAFGLDRVGAIAAAGRYISSRLKQDLEHFAKYKWLADYTIETILNIGLNVDPGLDQVFHLMNEC